MNAALARHYQEVSEAMNEEFHDNAVKHGFWEDVNTLRHLIEASEHEDVEKLLKRFEAMVLGEKIALMHSELSEALEAVRKDPTAPDQHCPEFSNLEIEFADLDIRLGDLVCRQGLRHSQAVLAKHSYNKSRPYKHGKIS